MIWMNTRVYADKIKYFAELNQFLDKFLDTFC